MFKELVKTDVRCISYNPLGKAEEWKATLLNELTDTRGSKLHLVDFSEEEMSDLITFICTT